MKYSWLSRCGFTALLCLFFMLFAPFFVQSAQNPTRTNKGKDFWLTFLPNMHILNTQLDSLQIFIVSDTKTSGTIEYRDITGKQFTRNFSINDPTQPFSFKIHFDGIELLGFTDGVNAFDNTVNQGEIIAPQSFHITANDDVAVFGLDHADASTDAFLAIPTSSLGYEYFVMSYNSDGYKENATINTTASSPSQFAVVATEDKTTVTMSLTTPAWKGGPSNMNLRRVLMKGDVFLIQANISADNLNNDLTGTTVKSDKPIALFAGHQRAKISVNIANGDDTRNYIIEEMPAVETWGKTACIVPPASPKPSTSVGSDIFRVLSSKDSTVIFVNGANVGRFDAGKFYEAPLTSPIFVKANNPILVAEFKKTSNRGILPSVSDSTGDPFMMLIPPTEQYLKSYSVVNFQAKDVSNSPIFSQQHITIVAPTVSLASVQLDGKPFSTTKFSPLSPNYSFADTLIADGIHTISADSGIGVFVSGYGIRDAYGYAGGMNLERIVLPDTLKSYLSVRDAAGKIGDTVSVSLILDSLSQSPAIQSTAARKFNATIRFNATMLTPAFDFQRGKIDSAGNQVAIIQGDYSDQKAGDKLNGIQFIAGLGDAEFCTIELVKFEWFNSSRDSVIPAKIFFNKNGQFHLLDVWQDAAGSRLVNPQENGIALEISPNPFSSQTSIHVEGDWSGQGGTLKIFDTKAELVKDLTTNLLTLPSKGNIQFDAGGLAKGTYYCRLTVGKKSVVRPMAVQ